MPEMLKLLIGVLVFLAIFLMVLGTLPIQPEVETESEVDDGSPKQD